MKHSIHDVVVNQTIRSLIGLKNILGKARAHAQERKFDENNFLDLKLAPDMFNFKMQVQIATDNAKAAAFRLSGKDIPKMPDEEKTLEELFARIDKTIALLRDFKETDFENYGKTKATFFWNPGKHLEGPDYLVSHYLPNFYFHMTTAYAILRSNGVPLGKGDFLGEQAWKNS